MSDTRSAKGSGTESVGSGRSRSRLFGWKSLPVRLLAPLVVSGVVVVAATLALMRVVEHRSVELTGITAAKALEQQVRTLRSFYTSEIISRAKKNKIRVGYDFQERSDTLPLPATFVHHLGQRVREENPGTSIRLYSEFPFPHRAKTETYDAFEKDALTALKKNPDQPFYRMEDYVDGSGTRRRSIRYAAADKMLEGCISCHNNHPETPKNDWKVGDMRGVVAVVVPIDEADKGFAAGTAQISGMFTKLSLTVGLGFLFAILYCAFVAWRIARQVARASEKVTVAARRISGQSEDQRAGAVRQSGAVEQIRTTINGLIESGQMMVNQTRKLSASANTSTGNNQRIAATTQELIRHARRIEEVLDTVKDIAAKSELLALNAGLEGTRCGEAGRGFSHVAGQMKRLAERVGQSATSMEGLLRDIAEASTTSASIVEEGLQLSAEVNRSAGSIDVSLEQLQTGILEVGEAILEVADEASSSLASAQESAKTVAGLVTLSDELFALNSGHSPNRTAARSA